MVQRDYYQGLRQAAGASSLSTLESDVNLVVIAYNEEANIEACLTSIFAQEGPEAFKLIVVDDGSTDRTCEIVESLQRDYPEHLRLIRHPYNKGRGAARRTGQDACSASTIGFIDSDIVLPKDWLTRAIAALNDADAISGVAVPDGDCAVIWRMFHPKSRELPSFWELTGNNVIFKRSALEMIGWPAESRVAEDCRMSRAMVEAGLEVMTVRDLKVEHREAKSYWRTMVFMREMGFYSTEILRDLRLFRLPDLAWICWVVTVLGSISLALTGSIRVGVAVAVVVAVTLAIDVGSMVQRFRFWVAPFRWVAASIANFPLILTYLAFRTWNAPRLLLRRRPILE
jgi:glycosyltransferase involved in cell wall biosynthesis